MAGPLDELQDQFGQIDVYFFDQLLRGMVPEGGRVLDAGCGGGRNVVWLLRKGWDVWAIDQDEAMVGRTRRRATEFERPDGPDRFRVEPLEACSFADAAFDYVICNAVLHFARDRAHFDAMTARIAALLKPGGVAFCRLGTTITLEGRLTPAPEAGAGWQRFPDGQALFLLGLDDLLERTEALEADLVDPIKTVNVQHRRCMTNWVWRRR
ncbi:MAG: class I SAM-dependent methyltransferase [Planctomycetota bacterium]|jgi:SAM-dependent methyltransferase